MSYTPKKNHAPVDDDVKVPAAIRAAAARSDALHKAAYENPDDTGQEQDAKQPPAGEVKGGEGEEQQVQQAAAPEAGTQDRQAQPPSQGNDWEHKYNSMKGRYDRQEETVRGLNQRIGQMEALLARAQRAEPAQVATPENTFKKISAEDREAYGEDFLDVAARAAQEKLNPAITKLERQLEELRGQVGGVAQQTQQTTQQALYTFLDEKMPEWRVLNKNPKFIAWANLPDAFSGDIRMNMMRDAFSKGEAPRVLRFFQGYLSDEAATDPASIKPDNVTPQGNGKVPLENFAAPGRAKAPAASQQRPGEKETISHAQIAAFYHNVNRGAYRGNEQEKNRLEAMIFEAQADGRVV